METQCPTEEELEAYFRSQFKTKEEYEAYCKWAEDAAAEQERLAQIPRLNGHEAKCESGECEGCGKPGTLLYSSVCCTLGYPGHPGAEFTDFGLCADCLS